MSELLKSEPTRLQPLWNEDRKEELREIVDSFGEQIDSKPNVKKLIESQSDCV